MYRSMKSLSLVPALFFGLFLSSAMAATPVPNSPTSNVFLRYGHPASIRDQKHPTSYEVSKLIYSSPTDTFVNTTSNAYGFFKTKDNKVYLVLEPGEYITSGIVAYELPHGAAFARSWSGKKPVPRSYKIGDVEATLEFVSFGIHSPLLPNQSTSTPTTTTTTTTTAPPTTTTVTTTSSTSSTQTGTSSVNLTSTSQTSTSTNGETSVNSSNQCDVFTATVDCQ
jgi:hypothetical protein